MRKKLICLIAVLAVLFPTSYGYGATTHSSLTGTELHIPFARGIDENKAASPTVGKWYEATDTKRLYHCLTAGTWEEYSNVPVGTVSMYGGSAAPYGYMICNGASISTTTYSSLFAVIGYSYGGSGANFSLPDMRNKFAIGSSSTKALASKQDTETHTHAIPHTHTYSGTSAGPSSSPHRVTSEGSQYIPINDHTHGYSGTTSDTSAANSGNNSLLPPYLALNFIIKY